MNLFQNVKYGVNCREAAERYGVSINRQGKALCPFHNDRHPSLYVADDHFYCFACGAHGDVIDFAVNFFDLPLYEAAQRLILKNAEILRNILYSGVWCRYEMIKEKRRQKAEAPDERFEEACHKLDEAEYYLDILAFGDSYERAEVVNYLLVDGRLDKLKEKINGRDAA